MNIVNYRSSSAEYTNKFKVTFYRRKNNKMTDGGSFTLTNAYQDSFINLTNLVP